MADTVLYLVRHAESRPDFTLPEADWPLSERGHSQAQELVPVLSALKIDVLYSSPYVRAMDTIKPAAARLGIGIRVHDDLRERELSKHGLGDAFWPTVQRSWAERDFALQGCESYNDCQRRIVPAIHGIAAAHPGRTIALASHGNALAVYLEHVHGSFGYERWRAMRNPDLFRIAYGSAGARWDGVQMPTSVGVA
ncbi:MAG: histidine phosphatase family protein [Myxococcales bacterium]|nr:histidine phosphatase family protein [Myxococcales bacterium]